MTPAEFAWLMMVIFAAGALLGYWWGTRDE